MSKNRTNYSVSAVKLMPQDNLHDDRLYFTTHANSDEDSEEVADFVVPDKLCGERLDKALACLLPNYSRSCIQGWIKAGHVWLNGELVKNRQTVFSGDRLQLALAVLNTVSAATAAFTPEPIALDIVYEDEHLVVINKPAGLVVHPAAGNWCGTLLNGLLYRYPESIKLPRAGIVHRLDKDTSGLMVVARTLESQTDLVRQLQARSVHRHYVAMAWGEVPAQGVINAPIGRDPHARIRMAVVSNGKPACTYFERLAIASVGRVNVSLLRCRLDTGRTHQIRVHFLSLKHPLVGDPLYGRAFSALPNTFTRQALHAYELGLIHPVHHAAMSWYAPLPVDMADLAQALTFPIIDEAYLCADRN